MPAFVYFWCAKEILVHLVSRVRSCREQSLGLKPHEAKRQAVMGTVMTKNTQRPFVRPLAKLVDAVGLID
jgi:hypothetical protein